MNLKHKTFFLNFPFFIGFIPLVDIIGKKRPQRNESNYKTVGAIPCGSIPSEPNILYNFNQVSCNESPSMDIIYSVTSSTSHKNRASVTPSLRDSGTLFRFSLAHSLMNRFYIMLTLSRCFFHKVKYERSLKVTYKHFCVLLGVYVFSFYFETY